MSVTRRTAILLAAVTAMCVYGQEAKKPGVVRIGVVLPEAQMGQGQGNGASVAEPVRAEMIKYLSGPAVEVLPLSSRISLQIDAESKAAQCDWVLYSTVTQKPGAVSAKKGFLKGATSAAHMMPIIGMGGGMSGMVATQAASATLTGISEATAMVKSKDEWTLGYRLVSGSGETFENQASAKAAVDREDVISPLLRQSAEVVLKKVMGK